MDASFVKVKDLAGWEHRINLEHVIQTAQTERTLQVHFSDKSMVQLTGEDAEHFLSLIDRKFACKLPKKATPIERKSLSELQQESQRRRAR
jgi:hypothetical protein